MTTCRLIFMTITLSNQLNQIDWIVIKSISDWSNHDWINCLPNHFDLDSTRVFVLKEYNKHTGAWIKTPIRMFLIYESMCYSIIQCSNDFNLSTRTFLSSRTRCINQKQPYDGEMLRLKAFVWHWHACPQIESINLLFDSGVQNKTRSFNDT